MIRKKFWQNIGLTMKDISEMPEREVSLLVEIMQLEEQHQAKNRTNK